MDDQRKQYTLAEMRAMAERGELGTPPGMDWDEIVGITEFKFRLLLCVFMGIAPQRVTVKIIDMDEAMPGKLGVDVRFDPELTEDERKNYEPAMRIICEMLGSRPPVLMASA